MTKIRTAFIGLGYRGTYLLSLVNKIACYQVVAVAEPNPEMLSGLQDLFAAGQSLPVVYGQGEDDYRRMLETEGLDLVFVCSPWHFHHSHAITVLNAGCHLALEVKGSLFEGEYRQLWQVAEARALNIYPLENTVFMRSVMAVWQMVEKGVFGEIIHAQGAYRHDLRDILINAGEFSDAIWRIKYYETENADIYPTHGVAPVCLMLNINRGNEFKSLTSFATKAIGLKTKIIDSFDVVPADLDKNYLLGDSITTIISTTSGARMTLLHETTLPRPRSLSYEIQGTKGAWNYDLKSIYIDGVSPREQWDPDEKYIAEHEHPFWVEWGSEALKNDVHHQGMDYIMLRVLAADFAGEERYPFSITDFETWANISIFSGRSIAEQKTINF